MRSGTPPDLGGLVWTVLLRRLLDAPRESPPEVTGRVSIAMALRDGAAGSFDLAVWGSAWHPAGGSRSLATEEPEPRREEATRLLEGAPPPGRTLVSLRAGDGLCLIVAGPSGRREFRLGGE